MRADCFPVFKMQINQMFPSDPKHKFDLRDKLTREERQDYDRLIKVYINDNEKKPRITYRDIYDGPIPSFLFLRGIEVEKNKYK